MFFLMMCMAVLTPTQQEDSARLAVRAPFSPLALSAAAGRAIPGIGALPLNADVIDSLARAHPELRAFLLREFVVPSHGLPDFTPPNDRDRFAAYMRERIPVSRFELMSQIARRHEEVTDVPLHPTAADYLVDIVGTIHWLLGLSP